MRKNPINRTCVYCNVEFQTTDIRKKFCNQSCAAKFNNLRRGPMSLKQRQKISQALIGTKRPKHLSGTEHTKRVGSYTRGKYHTYPVESIVKCSKRTITKIFKRLDIGCSRCGWKEAVCDIHHIYGRKIDNADHHDNLCYLCPNCHRAVHNHKISNEELTSLTEYIGDRWREVYYG